MATTETTTWFELAQALGPLIAQYRDEAERERHMPRPLHDAMWDAGLFAMARSRTHGGTQQPIEGCIRVIEEIARHDGSTAWNLMIGMHMSIIADYPKVDAARELYSPALRGMAGTFQPRGKATRVDGGYRVTGQWPFGSNCFNADWLLGAALVEGEDSPRIFYMRTEDCTILDTWHTAGLRGTGSHDFAAADVLVPERNSFPLAHFFTGPEGNPDAAYQRPFFDLAGPTLAAVSLGIARDAIESFVAMAGSKTPARGTWTLGTMHSTHMRLGEAESLLRSARAYLYEVARELDGPVGPDPDATSANCRLASATVTQNCLRAVEIVYELAGGTSIYENSRLERCFRDVHMPSHHAIASHTHFEMVGQYMLGHGLEFRR